jgi:hypothetical protein
MSAAAETIGFRRSQKTDEVPAFFLPKCQVAKTGVYTQNLHSLRKARQTTSHLFNAPNDTDAPSES